jgi:hypothetical protein
LYDIYILHIFFLGKMSWFWEETREREEVTHETYRC